ncbi:hypothetical protein NPIL_82921 [Nephila pilipes]|uniref:Uncharacterized protein n=1 Tax=Nephila pilipes TaxID=299642 RepID=A0A8X6U3S0_NEPPI|nr:hypothetical protein NPIL_82921 [Nephila pilipes]
MVTIDNTAYVVDGFENSCKNSQGQTSDGCYSLVGEEVPPCHKNNLSPNQIRCPYRSTDEIGRWLEALDFIIKSYHWLLHQLTAYQ